jgi:hypothetical protein
MGESLYSIFKRGAAEMYRHHNVRYLPWYLAELNFRYSYCVKLGYDAATRTCLFEAPSASSSAIGELMAKPPRTPPP